MIAGDRFGALTAVGPAGKRSGHAYWLFRCDCGAELQRTPFNIKNNKYNACPDCRKGSGSHAWSGVGELPKDVYNTIKNGATARGIEFDVSMEYLWGLFLSQDRKCALTRWDISFNPTYREKTEKTASLDRIDSSRGYLPGNLQWVHRDINKLKKNMPDARFIELCLAVAERFNEDN